MKRSAILTLLGFMLFIAPMVAGGTGYVVIVNKGSNIAKLSRHDLAAIFLKKTTRINDADVQPVDLAQSSAVRAEFSKVVLDKTVSAVNSYWQQRIFSGKGVPPAEMSEDDAVAFVRAGIGAIAYVSPQKAGAGVKIVEISE